VNQRAPAVSVHHYVSPTPEHHCVTRARILCEGSTEVVSLFAGDTLIATTAGMKAPLGIALCRQLGLVSRPRVSFDDVRREYLGELGPKNENGER
jgi:hypothetical protein